VIRHLYSCLFYLGLPLALLKLWKRSRKAPAYAQRIGERFAHIPQRDDQPLWIHAVSVGETVAIAPLIEQLLERQPDIPLLVTTTTPTGSERVKTLFGDRVSHCYCPYDLPHLLHRFLKRVKPRGLVIVETELWPNMLAACAKRKIPVLLANARLSERSARGYQKVSALTRPMMQQLSCVAAQDNEGGQRFVELGLSPEKLQVTGSIKFDHQPPADAVTNGLELRKQWGEHRPVLIAGSTREGGEDGMLLEVFGQLKQPYSELLLILVPRHLERFDSATQQAEAAGWNTSRRSLNNATAQTDVFVGDSMGEMATYYAAADLCFVGGSLVETGGQNPLEPAMLGKPVFMGPHLFNFSDIAKQLEQAGGLTVVSNIDELTKVLKQRLENPEQARQQGATAHAFVEKNQGALERLYQLTENVFRLEN